MEQRIPMSWPSKQASTKFRIELVHEQDCGLGGFVAVAANCVAGLAALDSVLIPVKAFTAADRICSFGHILATNRFNAKFGASLLSGPAHGDLLLHDPGLCQVRVD